MASSAVASSDLAARLSSEIAQLDKELAEIDLLIGQARAEAGRHEARRAATAETMAAAVAAASAGALQDPRALAELATQVVTLTRRATIMDAQVEVLDGKRKTLARFREAAAGYAASVGAGAFGAEAGTGAAGAEAGPDAGSPGSAVAAAVAAAASGEVAATARLLLGAQEDLRREIARAMHDGPAQSLTNIVLQAQIVERLVGGDAETARDEVRQLVAMVEHTLEATKSFIFDVRPMVLDDLGLMPTLRRAARDRGRRAGAVVEFDSLGTDRRLSMELESGIFRILDEALAGYLAGGAERVELHLDWGDAIRAEVAAFRATPTPTEAPASGKGRGRKEKERELPPTLAAMVEDRREEGRQAAEAVRRAAFVVLPPATLREIQGRAASLDIAVEVVDDGSRLRVTVPLPDAVAAGARTPATASTAR